MDSDDLLQVFVLMHVVLPKPRSLFGRHALATEGSPIVIWSQSSGVTVAVRRSARDEDGASVKVCDAATQLIIPVEFFCGTPLLLGRGVPRIPEHCETWNGVG
jgi:hypothetical protein